MISTSTQTAPVIINNQKHVTMYTYHNHNGEGFANLNCQQAQEPAKNQIIRIYIYLVFVPRPHIRACAYNIIIYTRVTLFMGSGMFLEVTTLTINLLTPGPCCIKLIINYATLKLQAFMFIAVHASQ